MNISDTFYVALCMTVLILGVVYWFWTQNQYIQRKLNLLENIVYEMKTAMNSLPEPLHEEPVHGSVVDTDVSGHVAREPESSTLHPAVYAPAPSSVLGEDEDLLHEELSDTVQPLEAEVPSDDLQPGGVGSSIKEIVLPDTSEKGSALDSMTLKELRRLAEHKKISGASTMRKQALIDAIRNVVEPIATFQDMDTN